MIEEMVSDYRMNLNFAQETTSGFDYTEQQYRKREADGCIDTVLNGREDRDDDTDEENADFQGRDTPKLIYCVGRGYQIANGVNDDS